MQNATHYPSATSTADADIIDAAKSRATFWKYDLEGAWVVTILVNKKICDVAHNPGQGYTCKRRGAALTLLNPTR